VSLTEEWRGKRRTLPHLYAKGATAMEMALTPLRFLDRSEALYPTREAVVCGSVRLPYALYAQRVRRLAHVLTDSLGLEKGDRVLYLGMNCHRLLELYYAVLPAGLVLVPVNIRLSPQDVAYILQDSAPKALFASPELLPLLTRLPLPDTLAKVLVYPPAEGSPPANWLDYEELLETASSDPPIRSIEESDLAEIFYTSGTTGRPRGVMLSHRALYLHALSVVIALEMKDRDRMLVGTVPLFHVNAWGTPQFMVATGGTQVVVPRFDPRLFCEAVERERVNKAIMVPTMLNALLSYPEKDRYNLSSLESIVLGGAPPVYELIRRAKEELGVTCTVGYGLTETCPVVTVSTIKAGLEERPGEDVMRRRTMTGIPVLGVEVRVVHEDGTEVAHDGRDVGEILVRGDNVMMGYWNRPEDTAQALRDGWLYTGDLATVDEEGYLNIVDRKKDIIISGGENISSVQVEDVLYRHPAVQEVAVLGKPDPVWGEVPVALVALRPGARVSEEELRAFAREHLAHFMVPKEVYFVSELPKTGTGKIVKAQLRRELSAWTQRPATGP
jgi:fatty-acyl-CoA synthase